MKSATEAQEQETLFQWLDLKGIPAFAIPNGGRRNVSEAAHMKRCGVKAGVPDIFIPVPVVFRHGLFIEMKRSKGGRLSEAQEAWIDLLEKRGYKAVVCKGAEEAIREVSRYLYGYD